VVQLLDWDLSAVTPVDYVDQLLTRLSDVIDDADQRTAVKRHAVTFIAMCTAGHYHCLLVLALVSLSLSLSLSVCLSQLTRFPRHTDCS